MSDESKRDLLGFLLGALEFQDHSEIEKAIDRSPELGLQAGKLRRSLKRIALDCRPDHEAPPPALAERTCQWIWEQAQKPTQLSEALPAELHSTSRTSLPDVIVAGGILLIALALFLPALEASRFQAGVVACQKKLQEVGSALHVYSEMQPDRRFPRVELTGNRAAAGIYAPILVQNKLVTDTRTFFCPQSMRVQKVVDQSVPTLAEIDEAVGDTLDDLKSRMGGTYGYSLGYIDNDRYVPPKNRNREHFALLGDVPSRDHKLHMTSNHGGRGLNLFFEDGHVKFFKKIPTEGPMDDPFINQKGYVAAGVDHTDAVLGTSSDVPFTRDYTPEIIRVSLERK